MLYGGSLLFASSPSVQVPPSLSAKRFLTASRTIILAGIFALSFTISPAVAQEAKPAAELYAETFDAHWESLRDDYPFFELYGVDWDKEREEHRALAIAAKSPTEFAWELVRLISALPDPHVSVVPAISTMMGSWSVPDTNVIMVERRLYIAEWAVGEEPEIPEAFAQDPFAYPELITLRGAPVGPFSQFLAAGPTGTSFTLQLQWPDGTITDHEMERPEAANITPPSKHFGDQWLLSGRVGKIGYIRIQTFSPKLATLGPDGKMTTMLRAALKELNDTESLILDFQGNGGGLVAASDPFLSSFVKRTQKYKWGNSSGQTRIIRPRSPRYKGKVIALVDEGSASGGEWAARILRDAGVATVIGGRTVGAEAAVHTSEGPDGSTVTYSAWPMVEPGVTSFQEVGIELDYFLPLTIKDVRTFGIEEAQKRIYRLRMQKALEVLGAPVSHVETLLALGQLDKAED